MQMPKMWLRFKLPLRNQTLQSRQLSDQPIRYGSLGTTRSLLTPQRSSYAIDRHFQSIIADRRLSDSFKDRFTARFVTCGVDTHDPAKWIEITKRRKEAERRFHYLR
jgi:hypothetical protein